MDLNGEYRIQAPRADVWRLINDPEALRACIPGCESLVGTPEDGFSARVTTRIGPVKATFDGVVTLGNVNPPESYTISGEGKGGVAGFAKGGADVHLADAGDETVLTYTVKAQVGGKLAQLGARLIDSTAKKLADEFFARLASRASAARQSIDAQPALSPLSSPPAGRSIEIPQPAARPPLPAGVSIFDRSNRFRLALAAGFAAVSLVIAAIAIS